MTGELFVLLTDDVVQDLVGALDGHLHSTLVPLRPLRPHRVVDEGLVLPGQGQSHLHLVLDGDRVDGVALPQPARQDGGQVGVHRHLQPLLLYQFLL